MPIRQESVTAVTVSMGLWIAAIAFSAPVRAAGATPAIAEDREELPTSDIRLVLRVDKSDLNLEDTLTIEFALLNASNTPIYVYRKLAIGGLGGVVLHIEDTAGQAVASPMLLDSVPVPPKPDDGHIFARLEPGHYLGSTVRGKVRDLIPKVGRFTLSARYLCPLPKELYASTQPQARTVWREAGVIASASVTVDVR